jgi:hypothetical protein
MFVLSQPLFGTAVSLVTMQGGFAILMSVKFE